MARVLLSSVTAPLGARHGDGSAVGYELLHAQVTRAQGAFSPRAVHLQYGLEYIAANLDTPVVTLHYATDETFVEELRSGGYSHVGIAFNLSTAHKMRSMCKLVRQHAPQATIILGGYGTVLPDEELLRHGDVICRGEGVSFMRELLGEPPRTPPFDHPLVVSKLKVLGLTAGSTGLIFAGLGCPNGCDFCATSHFFDRRHIRLLPTGQDLLEVIEGYRALDPEIEFTVLDEDFLLNKRRAMELRELLLARDLHLDMFVFASVKALSKYSPQQLVEMGVGGVWIGFEGSRSGYAKREGRPVAELVADLKRHGILVLASMIVGLDYQTPAIVRAEFEELMGLGPTLSQFLIYGPTPGTPLGERALREGLFRPEYAADPERMWRESDGFSCLIRHPHMAPQQIEELQRWCFEEDFRRQGPSVVRTAEVWLEAWEALRDSPVPALRRRAEHAARRLARVGTLVPAAVALAPSREARRRAIELGRQLRRLTSGKDRLLNAALGVAALPVALATAAALKLDLDRAPNCVRHDWGDGARPLVVRLGKGCLERMSA